MFSSPRQWLSVILLSCSIALFGMSVHLIWEEDAFRAGSTRAVAQIKSVYQTGRGATLWHVRYGFSTQDNPGIFYAGPTRMADNDMFYNKPNVGDEVPIRYLGSDPAQNAIFSLEPLRWPAFLRFCVGLIVLWGAFAAYRASNRS